MGNNNLKYLIIFSCNGGDHNSAFQYFVNQGIVSEGCKPYPISPDPKANAPKNTECVKKCDSSYKTNIYANDKIKGENLLNFSHKNQAVMEEIINNGPVVAEFLLYEDFYNYSGGIYQHKNGNLHGYYYAKIVGWGTENNVGYWKAAASFGSNWGKK
jgi:cathepsin B